MAEMIISGEPWISATCQGELCRCGAPAVRKVGEEISFDDPNPSRHNLTAYVCAAHFAELLGPAAAYQVGLKTLASAGRCFCGFWPCATHQIDDVSTREENAMIPKEQADLADALIAELGEKIDYEEATAKAGAILDYFKRQGWKIVEVVG